MHCGELLLQFIAVQESVNKSAASAASPEDVKFQAVIKSAASAASLRGGSGLDHGLSPPLEWAMDFSS